MTGNDRRRAALVRLLDLGVIVPAAVAAAVGLWCHHSWARLASHVMIGWFSFVRSSVADETYRLVP